MLGIYIIKYYRQPAQKKPNICYWSSVGRTKPPQIKTRRITSGKKVKRPLSAHYSCTFFAFYMSRNWIPVLTNQCFHTPILKNNFLFLIFSKFLVKIAKIPGKFPVTSLTNCSVFRSSFSTFCLYF